MLKLLIATLLVSTFVSAKEKPVTIGLCHLEPFVIEKNGVISGLDPQFYKELTTRSKIKFKYEVLPIERFMGYAKAGRFDLGFDLSGNPAFKDHYKEIPTSHILRLTLISTQKELDFKNGKLIVGRARGYECPLFDEKQLKNVEFFEADSIEQGIRLLKVGRINAICSDLQTFYYKYTKGSFKVYTHPKFSFEFKVSLFLKKTLTPIYEDKFKEAIKQMDEEKVFEKIFKYSK